MRAAVVGHVEWVTFVRVPCVPERGTIVHGGGTWDDAAGGGAVAAVELARLGADVVFFTALGDDEPGREARTRLEDLGVEVRAAVREGQPQRRAVTLLDADGERTIVVLGERMVPRGEDSLGWEDLAEMDTVYATGGDAEALRRARRARALVATPRLGPPLREAEAALDALVYSDRDPDEAVDLDRFIARPRATVRTLGAEGGAWVAGTEEGTWHTAPLPGPRADAYGCGDSFAAGVTFALGEEQSLPEAVQAGARSGADCLTRHGPYPAAVSPPESSVSSGA